MTWDGSVAKLYLNDTLVQQSSYTTATPNWSAASNFDLGAYEYLTYGGYNSCDDIIDEFTVTGAAKSPGTLISANLLTPRAEIEASIGPRHHPSTEWRQRVCSGGLQPRGSGHTHRTLPPRGCAVGLRPLGPCDLPGRRQASDQRNLFSGFVRLSRSDRFPLPRGPPVNLAGDCGRDRRRVFRTWWKRESRKPVPESLPRFVPATGPGGTVSIRATGMNWLAKFSTVRPVRSNRNAVCSDRVDDSGSSGLRRFYAHRQSYHSIFRGIRFPWSSRSCKPTGAP